MSGGVVFREALRRMNALTLPPAAGRDVLAALEAAHLLPILQLLYEAGHEAGLEREPLLGRAAGCFLSFAAGNLADDLIDGDVTYLEDPVRLAPSAQFLLQNLAYQSWLEAGVPSAALARVARELAAAVGGQHDEVRTETWTADLFRAVGVDVAGRQWRAYLEALWAGTPLEARAERVGLGLGIIGHTAEDIRTDDPRFFTMPPEEQRAVVEWALATARALEVEDLRTVRFVLEASRPILEGQLQ